MPDQCPQMPEHPMFIMGHPDALDVPRVVEAPASAPTRTVRQGDLDDLEGILRAMTSAWEVPLKGLPGRQAEVIGGHLERLGQIVETLTQR